MQSNHQAIQANQFIQSISIQSSSKHVVLEHTQAERQKNKIPSAACKILKLKSNQKNEEAEFAKKKKERNSSFFFLDKKELLISMHPITD